ncbi:MAG: hypothetical protein ACE5FJ_08375 [Gemmatimonadales bacterium]
MSQANNQPKPRLSVLGPWIEDTKGDTEQGFRKQMVALLVAESPVAELLHLVMTAAVLLIVWGDVEHFGLSMWALAVMLTTVYRMGTRRLLTSLNAPPQAFFKSTRIAVTAAGLAWGAGAVMFAFSVSFEQLMLIGMIFAGLAAGAIGTLGADRYSFCYWIIPQSGLFAGALLIHGRDRIHVVAFMLVVLYIAIIALLYTRFSRTLKVSLKRSTESRAREQTATRETRFLDDLLASTPTAIAAVRANGTTMLVNPAFEGLFGYTAVRSSRKHAPKPSRRPRPRRRSWQT